MVSYRKHFIPLESDPDVFNELLSHVGAPPTLCFQDVLSLEGPYPFPRPVLALILVVPTTDGYERHKGLEESTLEKAGDGGEKGDIIWYPQTINNACGLYAILHALSNGAARELLGTNSTIATIIEACSALPPDKRFEVLEGSTDLEDAYKKVALQGTSRIPNTPEDEVDFHYICFVKSCADGRLYELDGDRSGAVDRGVVLGPEQDVLSPGGVDVIRGYMEREHGNSNFSLMALVNCERPI